MQKYYERPTLPKPKSTTQADPKIDAQVVRDLQDTTCHRDRCVGM